VAGAPFQLVRRPVEPLPRPEWHQAPAATQPFSDLVALEGPRGGIALLAPGLREVEARRGRSGTRLSLTLLRSVRWLSRDDLVTRQGEAGPCFPVDGARQLGRIAYRLALLPYRGSLLEADLSRRAREHADPPRVLELARAGSGVLPARLALLAVEPACVQLVALLPEEEGTLEARLVNLLDGPVRARLLGPYRARRVRLDGRPLPGRVETGHLRLRAGEIISLRLERHRLERAARGRRAPRASDRPSLR